MLKEKGIVIGVLDENHKGRRGRKAHEGRGSGDGDGGETKASTGASFCPARDAETSAEAAEYVLARQTNAEPSGGRRRMESHFCCEM